MAHYEQFLLFPQCFLPVWRTFCHFYQIWNCRLQTLSVWKSLKFVVWERVKLFPKWQILDSSKVKEFADNSFKFDENSGKFPWRVENTGGKGEIAHWAISPFPTVFSKDLYSRHRKTRAWLGKGWPIQGWNQVELPFQSKSKIRLLRMCGQILMYSVCYLDWERVDPYRAGTKWSCHFKSNPRSGCSECAVRSWCTLSATLFGKWSNKSSSLIQHLTLYNNDDFWSPWTKSLLKVLL